MSASTQSATARISASCTCSQGVAGVQKKSIQQAHTMDEALRGVWIGVEWWCGPIGHYARKMKHSLKGGNNWPAPAGYCKQTGVSGMY